MVLVLAAFAGTAADAQEKKDSSGTNPAVQSRNLTISNEYRSLPDHRYFNITDFRYTEPLGDGSSSIRLTVPLDMSNIIDGDVGLGDVAAKLTWVPSIDRKQAVILSSELYAPTATR